MPSSQPTRYYRRYRGYDYTRGASLFVTVVTEPRAALFGKVVNAAVELTPLGKVVAESLASMPQRIHGVALYRWVVMPDHIHCRVHLRAGFEKPLETLGSFFSRFKSYTTRRSWNHGHSGKLWQQGYHDRLCSTRPFIEAVERYIRHNPLKYELRYNQPDALRIREPLGAARLDADTFWKGVGNERLLDADRRLLGLRVSRRLDSPDQIARIVSRCRDAAAAGYTVVSGFISPGEKAVREALLAMPCATLVQILPDAMPHDYLPQSLYLEAIRDRCVLILAKGNEEAPLSRERCEALNGDVVDIASAGQGLAVYWKPEGAQRLRSAHKTTSPGSPGLTNVSAGMQK